MTKTDERTAVSADAPGFAPVCLRILTDERITDPTTIAVFAALGSFIDYGTGDCFPGLETIGKRARITGRAVQPQIQRLIALGYVQKISGAAQGKANRYHLVDPWGRAEGRKPASRGLEADFQGGRKPASTERDSLNETQEREGEAPRQAQAPRAEHDSPPLFATLREEAKKAGAPVSAITPALLKATSELKAGEGEILAAFRLMLETRPDKLPFFASDFARYRRELAKRPKPEAPFCPECHVRGWHALGCSQPYRDAAR